MATNNFMDKQHDDNSSLSDEARDGLRFLLGGIDPSDIGAEAWDNESDTANENGEATLKHMTLPFSSLPEHRTRLVETPLFDLAILPADNNDKTFAYAFQNPESRERGPQITRPSVKIVDMSANGRGFGLVATEKIQRGQVIFTEQAAFASQLSPSSIRACQNCFRSLEPLSSCNPSKDASLPLPHLWPILSLVFSQDDGRGEMRTDRYGRMECRSCSYLFCCQNCFQEFTARYGKCCLLARMVEDLPLYLNAEDTIDAYANYEIEPAILLALRLFLFKLHQVRRTVMRNEPSFDDLCGDCDDLDRLEIGVPMKSPEDGSVKYDLSRLHTALIKRWQVDLATEEVNSISLGSLHRYVCIAARNGFGIRTQNPFRSYYAAALRSIGGRNNSEKNLELQQQVAGALGEVSLQRGMDQTIEERVAPEIVCLFLLISRINHSCAPNAKVLSQEFVDAHTDLVAAHDIEAGEEITISYIRTGPGVGRLNQNRRRRELFAKYLFWCNCSRCREESGQQE